MQQEERGEGKWIKDIGKKMDIKSVCSWKKRSEVREGDIPRKTGICYIIKRRWNRATKYTEDNIKSVRRKRKGERETRERQGKPGREKYRSKKREWEKIWGEMRHTNEMIQRKEKTNITYFCLLKMIYV